MGLMDFIDYHQNRKSIDNIGLNFCFDILEKK